MVAFKLRLIASSLSQGVIFRPRVFEKWEWHNRAQVQGNDYLYGALIGHNVSADKLLGGHIRAWCGIWPMADLYCTLHPYIPHSLI